MIICVSNKTISLLVIEYLEDLQVSGQLRKPSGQYNRSLIAYIDDFHISAWRSNCTIVSCQNAISNTRSKMEKGNIGNNKESKGSEIRI